MFGGVLAAAKPKWGGAFACGSLPFIRAEGSQKAREGQFKSTQLRGFEESDDVEVVPTTRF